MSVNEINPADYQPNTLIHNHPDWKYHQAPGLSSSQIKTFVLQSPQHYYQHYVAQTIQKNPTEAMQLGTLVHSLVLEPDDFEKRFTKELDIADCPDAMKTVPELKAYCELNQLATTGVKQELIKRILEHDNNAPVWDVVQSRQREGKKKVISSKLWDKARFMRDGVMANRDAYELLSVGMSEVSVWANYRLMFEADEDGRERAPIDTLVKCRCDWWRPDGICVDLKTCACSSPEAFSKDCARFGYGLQDIHYSKTLNSAGKDCHTFAFIAVENEPPYLAQVYILDVRSRELCRQRYEKAMHQLHDCLCNDEWPGYTLGLDMLALPHWHLKQLEKVA